MSAVWLAVAATLITAAATPDALPAPYRPGQVWSYRTRPADPESLLKIGAAEEWPVGSGSFIYHISVINVHLGPAKSNTVIGHMPFSKEAMDVSVVKQVQSGADFPDVTGGVADWRKAKGGVFTIPLANAVGFVDQTIPR